ncbi:MAG: hypothetical protein KKC37_08670, partial [Proteobacteria bacterium]|nr:hypothetical protein [Pseudomonadota bacterium]
MKSKSLKVLIVVLALALVAGMSYPQPVQAKKYYHLGVALAITGTGALYCRDGVDAIKLAVEE